ncbi:MAG: DUF1902 domain-containing protein [Rhizobiaceae bacterium]
MSKRLKITVRAFWDDDAQVWAAQADGDIGLFTEAETLEALQKKLPALAQDLLEGEFDGGIDIELVTTSHPYVDAA